MTYKTLTAGELNRVLSTTSPHSFVFNIARMHDIYRLPKNTEPTLDPVLIGESAISRLDKFHKTMLAEISGYNVSEDGKPCIREKMVHLSEMTGTNEEVQEAVKDVLTDIADWLAGMSVYCRSEAMKFGLPLEDVQDAVMGSNFTKLPSDGIPVYDANGKFQKDLTNFVPPEPAIKSILFSGLSADEQ